MNNYNPMLDYQRNNLMAQQQMIQQQLNQLNSQRQTFNPYPQQTDSFFIRQVGSIEEVKGYPVEPQMMYLFPDTGTGDIYLKRLNTDNGKSEIIIYKPQPSSEKAGPMQSDHHDVPEIETRLSSIEKKLGEVYESISSLKTHSEPVRSYATADAVKNASPESSEVQPNHADVEW